MFSLFGQPSQNGTKICTQEKVSVAFCGPKHRHFVSGHPPGKLGGHFINIMSMLLQASKLLLLINKECFWMSTACGRGQQ